MMNTNRNICLKNNLVFTSRANSFTATNPVPMIVLIPALIILIIAEHLLGKERLSVRADSIIDLTSIIELQWHI